MRARAGLPVLFALLLLPAWLWAHGALKQAEPAADAVLDSVPRMIRLTFTEPAELAVGRVELTGPGGWAVGLTPLRHGDSSTVMIADILEPLIAGEYTVAWQVAGRDGHPVRGTYRFRIAEGAAGSVTASESRQASAAAVASSSSQATSEGDVPEVAAFDAESPLFAAIRWLGFAGLLSLIGSGAFAGLIIPAVARRGAPATWATESERRARRVGVIAVAVLFVAFVLRLGAQATAVNGSPLDLDPALVTDTSWGRAWLIQLAGIAVALGGLALAGRSRQAGWLMVGAGFVVVAAGSALSGHAAAVPDAAALAMTVDTLHVLGAGAWLGTLMLIVAVGLPLAIRHSTEATGSVTRTLVEAFSPYALSFAGLVVASGVVSAWMQLGALAALWETRYGQVLLVKLGLVAMLLALGAYNGFRARPSLGDAVADRRIGRSSGVELVAALLVLAVTAVLVATPTGVGAQ